MKHYPFTVGVSKCGGNTIDDSQTQVYVPNKVNNMNVKVFNLISRVNETRFLVQYKLCRCKSELSESGCNSNQKWNHDESPRECHDESPRECKVLDDQGSCKDDYMWNSSTRDCKCNKACKIDKYLKLKIDCAKNT